MKIFAATLLAALLLAACTKRPAYTADYLATCEGPPLRSPAEREKAMTEGYVINRSYDCITKESFAQMAEERARWEAANTRKTKAETQAERAAAIAAGGGKNP